MLLVSTGVALVVIGTSTSELVLVTDDDDEDETPVVKGSSVIVEMVLES